jgi:hypothetical protein
MYLISCLIPKHDYATNCEQIESKRNKTSGEVSIHNVSTEKVKSAIKDPHKVCLRSGCSCSVDPFQFSNGSHSWMREQAAKILAV